MNLSNEQKKLIEYFEQVLGVKSILCDNPNLKQALSEDIQTYFFVEDLSDYLVAENDLLMKMIQAMKFKPSSYQILDLASGQYTQFLGRKNTQLIVFKNDPQKMDETYSPRRLLKEPAFKKIAWDFLQKRMLE